MSFTYLTNVPLEQAKKDYLWTLIEQGFAARTERIRVQDAFGRITARAVYAYINAPHYACSAMDGIALYARDSFGATDTTPVTLSAVQFKEVDTGDPIPEGCDAVIMVEELVRNEDGRVTIHAPAAPWQHIRQIGEDICAGEMILPSFMEVTPAAIGAMIAGGVLELEVIATPVVGIIPTGDEIVPPCSDPKPGDIMEFNSSIFSAMLASWGAEAKTYPIVPDKYDQIRDMLEKAAAECDMVILNAGSSAGRDDYSSTAVREVGEVLYHGIAIKPGKPAILGYKGAVPILGVPGYPVSGIIVIDELLRPLIDRWYSRETDSGSRTRAKLTRPVVSGLKYQEYVRVRMGYVGNTLMASPLPRGSGVVSSFMKADGMLEVPQGTEGYTAGEEVRVRLLTEKQQLKSTLVVIGSHDPLLDELADLIHREDRRLFLSSAHVGSMGGVMAVRRGEAHAAGIHLLDTATGEYNRAYIKKYFPHGGVYLIRCVGRQQGLMLQKGNPLGITSFADIAQDGVRYVNRQKGSGTRVLMDYLCDKYGVDRDAIYGYEREELTHNSVAVQIAGDSADAGMGIYSTAKLYDLDFLPICVEEYDLLIPEQVWNTGMVRQLVRTLKSGEFKRRIEAMGGYTLDHPGEIIDVF
ncbi:MAG: molybdopterin biosynthesis protein [Oscillospiraceae bacterium]|nr:molybdopterin biosynthesis protein [Oscillospiraceae bacterium]